MVNVGTSESFNIKIQQTLQKSEWWPDILIRCVAIKLQYLKVYKVPCIELSTMPLIHGDLEAKLHPLTIQWPCRLHVTYVATDAKECVMQLHFSVQWQVWA